MTEDLLLCSNSSLFGRLFRGAPGSGGQSHAHRHERSPLLRPRILASIGPPCCPHPADGHRGSNSRRRTAHLKLKTTPLGSIAEARDSFTYWPGTQTVPFFAGPRVLNRPHAITADADIPPGGAEGVLLCQGSGVGGWSFYLKDGKLHYVHNYVRRALHQV